jgi:hypothetical protein
MFRWFLRKEQDDLGGCRTCGTSLITCPGCLGEYVSAACTACTTGAICPIHHRFRY